MTQHPQVPLAGIVSELKQLCQARRTGVLRIVTDKNHAASFGLSGGRIVAVRYRIKRNADALPLLKQVEAGQYSFNEGESLGDESALLPPNEEILGGLIQGSVQAGGPLEPTVPAPQPPPDGDTAISPAAQAVLEAALTEHIGPMAGIVCRNVFAKAPNLAEAVSALASKIPNAERAHQFEREVRSKLA